jgi:hypothetical protein
MQRRTLAAILALALIPGCGARSSIFDGVASGLDPGPEDRLGGCANPIELPFTPQTVRGRLLGGGRVEGWCGEFSDDVGREDVYKVAIPYNTDVIITMTEETDFDAVLRITADACEEEAAPVPEICVAPEIGEYRYFFAEGGRDYYIAIDSPAGVDGRYGFSVAFGWPPFEACSLHSSTISAEPGGFFRWANTFGLGQGQVDGSCGGPGRENMFRVDVTEPTLMRAVARLTGMQGVLSVRSSCGGLSELACEASPSREGALTLEYYFDVPGEYYLVIDQVDVAGGSYELEIEFL